MSRLIDADKLIEDLTYTIETMIEEYEDDDFGVHNEHDLKYLKGNIDFSEIAKRLIEKQPTAFDVDKVISNIWDKSELIHIKDNCYDEIEDYIRTTDASEIVKAGGRDEDTK